MLKRLFRVVLTIVFALILQVNFAVLADSQGLSGEKIFTANCAGCHLNGGNIIRRGKNLKMKALHKYGYDSPEDIAEIVTNGKNNMSAYNDHLDEEQIKQVAEYVWQQAENNWRS